MKPRILIIIIAALAIAFAACGGDDDDDATPTSAPATSQPTAAATMGATSVATTPAGSPTPGECPPVQTQGVTSITFERTAQPSGVVIMDDAAVVEQPCFDRIEFEFAGVELPTYRVQYVLAPTECGSGEPVTTAGAAQIQVQFTPVDAHDQQGNSTLDEREFTPNFPSLKEAVLSCDFEAETTWILGTEEKAYTVSELANPPRVIIEIAH